MAGNNWLANYVSGPVKPGPKGKPAPVVIPWGVPAAAPADATRVAGPAAAPVQRTIGAQLPGNIPLPMGQLPVDADNEGMPAKVGSVLWAGAQNAPVSGQLIGGFRAGMDAGRGHPLAAALGLGAALVPGGEGGDVERIVASRAARAAEKGNPEIHEMVEAFRNHVGNAPMPIVSAVDPAAGQRMARVYASLPKNDPNAKAAYDALNSEIADQLQAMKDAGYKVEYTDENPYANSTEMVNDVRQNKRLKVFKTAPDQAHPYMTPEQNDAFRAVHDFFAHASYGNQFGPIGEENAYRVHASMLSPEAQQALATETRGQNSFVNFGPNAHITAAQRPYAEQKAALWPKELTGDYDTFPAEKPATVSVSSPGDGEYAAPRVNRPSTVQPGQLPPQINLPRFVGPRTSPQRVQDIEDEAYKTFTSPTFVDWLRQGGNFPWYYTPRTQQKAVDALGDAEGPGAFARLIQMMGGTTARSAPPNNLRRAGYYYALDRQGNLFPDALEAGVYKDVPEGMGHLANDTHHQALAGLLRQGYIDPFDRPKPASFVENLSGNGLPYTGDTRMSDGTVLANQRLFSDPSLGAFVQTVDKNGKIHYTPRPWAYAPLERAAQRAAALHAGMGLVPDLVPGMAPTAHWQAGIWDTLGPVLGGSRNAGTFDDIFDNKLAQNAQAWNLPLGEANRLFWQGHPFDLPLNTELRPSGLLTGEWPIPR